MHADAVNAFLDEHRLPPEFRHTIDAHYRPLARWVAKQLTPGAGFLLGINGGQGSGKSTLADYLRMCLSAEGWRVAALSIDDFYLTRAGRQTLAEDVHPLLATRGVPGTHDVDLLRRCLRDLKTQGEGRTTSVPRFDKSADDRAARETWTVVDGPVDLIVLEGWCVGSRAESSADLSESINALEAQQDKRGAWRAYVNAQLAGPYAELFAQLDALVFLQVPSFAAAYRWRVEQEQKLAAKTDGRGAHLMSADEIAEFMQHYERLTRANLATLPSVADVVIRLGEQHECIESRFRDSPSKQCG